jgi:hypothetical protein
MTRNIPVYGPATAPVNSAIFSPSGPFMFDKKKARQADTIPYIKTNSFDMFVAFGRRYFD